MNEHDERSSQPLPAISAEEEARILKRMARIRAEQEGKPLHGGQRPGAGRHPKGLVSAKKVMRVPEAYEGVIRALITHLDATSQYGRHYDPICSEPVFFRSLHDQAQFVSFTVAPLRMKV